WITGIRMAGFYTYQFSVLSAFIFTEYVIAYWEKDKKNNKIEHVVSGIIIVIGIILLLAAQHTGHLFIVHPNGSYETGAAQFLGYLFVAIFMVMDLVISFVHRKDLNYRQQAAFGCYILFPLISILVRKWIPEVYLVALASSLSMMVMLIVEIFEHQRKFRLQEEKNDQLKVDLMLGQIQPHFLFNVLYVIQALCKDNPEAAHAVRDFSMFLRHNMDSLSVNTPIPFKEELDHTQLYVSLQQLRFGTKLNVVYDLACIDFSLPTLTLQPLVENAIRYGVRKSATGEGVVKVSTKEFPDHYEVSVQDDGPGFVEGKTKNDGVSHVGINNVRERLKAVSGGSLIFNSAAGKGTKVTMILPKQD
ncbi:MAG: histidine kinase, partial [Lachnospiraceae bacterium]|nr:histidine kinase [Lachnospiraceae bacterium]